MIPQDKLDRLDALIRQARDKGLPDIAAEAARLHARALAQNAAEEAAPRDVSPVPADPMTRAHAREDDGLHKLRKDREECGATRRDGQPCRAPAIEGGLVCRRHGGAAFQVWIKARHRVLMEASCLAHLEWQKARGTPRAFDALCEALQAQRGLEAFEAKMKRVAGLRAELRRSRAAQDP